MAMSFKNNRHCGPDHMLILSGRGQKGKMGKWERDTEEMGGTRVLWREYILLNLFRILNRTMISNPDDSKETTPTYKYSASTIIGINCIGYSSSKADSEIVPIFILISISILFDFALLRLTFGFINSIQSCPKQAGSMRAPPIRIHTNNN